jgi:hypothetical protein
MDVCFMSPLLFPNDHIIMDQREVITPHYHMNKGNFLSCPKGKYSMVDFIRYQEIQLTQNDTKD